MNQREKLVDLIIESVRGCARNWAEVIADHLLENGVVVIDTDVVSHKNRPLISTVASLPINEVIDLVTAKEEGRLIVPPCKVGDLIYMPWEYGGTSGVALLGVTYMVVDKGELRIMTDFSSDDEEYFDLYFGGKFVISDFGKTVFLTREEAEKALSERSKEDEKNG